MQQRNGEFQRAPPRLEQFKVEIKAMAKEIFLKRQYCKTVGDALSDWLQAEEAIKERYNISLA
jgi:hypothetical protein